MADASDSEIRNGSESLNLYKAIKLLNCGLTSGLLQATVFNPWDRALYLSVKNDRAFLHKSNFVSPMAGVFQTIIQRTISAGLYFPLEEIFSHLLFLNVSDTKYKPWVIFLAGNLAGATNGILMNPFARIKYHYWGKVDCGQENFFTTAKDMLVKGGIRPFFCGATATIQRDLIFGGCFALFRHEILITHTSSNDLVVNLLAGCLATIISSPFNYVRNIHYSIAPEEKAEKASKILYDLIVNASKENSFTSKLQHIQSRLRIGWGTARVGVGMAFGASIYKLCSKNTISS